MTYSLVLKELVEYLDDLIMSGYKIGSVVVDYTDHDGTVSQQRFTYHKTETLQKVQKGCIL